MGTERHRCKKSFALYTRTRDGCSWLCVDFDCWNLSFAFIWDLMGVRLRACVPFSFDLNTVVKFFVVSVASTHSSPLNDLLNTKQLSRKRKEKKKNNEMAIETARQKKTAPRSD